MISQCEETHKLVVIRSARHFTPADAVCDVIVDCCELKRAVFASRTRGITGDRAKKVGGQEPGNSYQSLDLFFHFLLARAAAVFAQSAP
jgi:hypothetical protein